MILALSGKFLENIFVHVLVWIGKQRRPIQEKCDFVCMYVYNEIYTHAVHFGHISLEKLDRYDLVLSCFSPLLSYLRIFFLIGFLGKNFVRTDLLDIIQETCNRE